MGQRTTAGPLALAELQLDDDTLRWVTDALLADADRWQLECVACSDADVRLLALWAGCRTSEQYTELVKHSVEPDPDKPEGWGKHLDDLCAEWAWRRDTALDVLTARHRTVPGEDA